MIVAIAVGVTAVLAAAVVVPLLGDGLSVMDGL